jgi:hypothetical protein
MVMAILEGRKTQTRRIIKPQPKTDEFFNCSGIKWKDTFYPDGDILNFCPYGKVGDTLWVREIWAVGKCADGIKPSQLHQGTWLKTNGGLWYRADKAEPTSPISPKGKWRPSIFMPRWACRIFLEVTGIRVEILREISDEDIICEGFECREDFYGAIIKINKAKNPEEYLGKWCWVVEFKRKAKT